MEGEGGEGGGETGDETENFVDRNGEEPPKMKLLQVTFSKNILLYFVYQKALILASNSSFFF